VVGSQPVSPFLLGALSPNWSGRLGQRGISRRGRSAARWFQRYRSGTHTARI